MDIRFGVLQQFILELGYGRLYNWYTVSGDTLAPLGWHIPTIIEYQTLSTYLGGDSVSGGHLKETGLTYWNSPNTGADNSSEFSSLGSGYRSDYDGSFTDIHNSSFYITNRNFDINTSSAFGIFYNSSNISIFDVYKKLGMSVRCIRPKSSYGALYNWYAVSDIRNLAPVDCHIPTDVEWQTLSDYLGGDSISGGKLKDDDILNWNTPNTGADNSSKFIALPSGYRSASGNFFDINDTGYWWSSTAYNSISAWYRNLYSSSPSNYSAFFDKKAGCVVRCICDTSGETITDIDGNIYDTVVIGTQRWLVQDLKVTKYRNGNSITNVTGNTGWSALTTEAYCYYNNSLPTANQPTSVIDYDSNIYDVVEIGRQLWTKKNFKCTHLNDGTSIPEVTNPTTWASLTTGAWCSYNNDHNNI